MALTAALAALTASLLTAPTATAAAASDTSLYLVTLRGPGTAILDRDVSDQDRTTLTAAQDDTLTRVGAPPPLYRWTAALNGYAVHLTADQAADLAVLDEVVLVEENSLRRLAADTDLPATATLGRDARTKGGAGTVIGIVDSGIWPESSVFAAVPGLGRPAPHFDGRCVPGDDWTAESCSDKLVGARWFVAGFGTDNLRSTSSLSARDDHGHGTQVASVAAGNAGVSVQVGEESFGVFHGVAPQARIAAYKACWTAPDPEDDGCATADLVTAVDRATADGVDVLNLSVAGSGGFDTLERALLGAAEADIVVAAAAGNDADAYAAHPVPWVTTVGAVTGVQRRGSVVLGDGRVLRGAMSSRMPVGPARIVRGADAAAPGADPAAARSCEQGSLDAGEVAGAIVVCERGSVARADKSEAVRRADGIAMVLANTDTSAVVTDMHAVPTVHLDVRQARELDAALAAGQVRATVRPDAPTDRARVPAWSAAGDSRGGIVKPDVVATGTGILGAVPPSYHGRRWDFFSGTSAATAQASGEAAVLRARHRDWPAPRIRSALATSATDVAGSESSLQQGAGRTRLTRALRPGLVFDQQPTAYRRYLVGATDPARLNTPSILLDRPDATVTRRVTNVGKRPMYYSSAANGFRRHDVTVSPAALRIAPGETRTFRVRVSGRGGAPRLDSGWITWRGADGTRVRIPLVLTR